MVIAGGTVAQPVKGHAWIYLGIVEACNQFGRPELFSGAMTYSGVKKVHWNHDNGVHNQVVMCSLALYESSKSRGDLY